MPKRKVHRIQWTLGNGVEEERNKKPNFFIQAQKDNRFLEKVVVINRLHKKKKTKNKRHEGKEIRLQVWAVMREK